MKVSGGGDFHAAAWSGWPANVPSFVERLSGVVIEQRDAIDVIKRLDTADTLFFIDPPYVISTRSSKGWKVSNGHGYRFEMNDSEHANLAETLRGLKGMVMLAGYHWSFMRAYTVIGSAIDRNHLSYGGKAARECLWFNPAAASARPQATLMEVTA